MSVPLLEVAGLTKRFVRRGGLFGGTAHPVTALDGVDLSVARGETLGVVGESGSGKSTLGRCLLRLVEPDAGSIVWHERDGRRLDLRALGPAALRAFRPRLQIVFQDPRLSLNPARRVWEVVGEGLILAGRTGRSVVRERAAGMLSAVGMGPEHLDRFPHEFSGGQRQRLAIARALVVEPELVVCDEVTSALDTRTQAQVLDLLVALQERTGVALLFISHDLPTVARVSRRIVVLDAGRVVETGPPAELFANPVAAPTRALLEAIPGLDPARRRFRGPPRESRR